MRTLLEALALIWLIAHEQIDPDDGEERDAGQYLAVMNEEKRIATPACALARNDRKEAVA